MSIAEAEFNKYDWASSSEWKTYLDNLYPIPSIAQMPKYKRKFYRANINAELPDVAPTAAPTAPPAQASRPYQPATATAPAPVTRVQKVWTIIATTTLAIGLCCALGSILPLAIQPMLNRLTHGLLALGFVAAAISENGLPKMNFQSWYLLCFNGNVQALAMLLVGLSLRVALTIYSPAISAAAYVAKRLNFHHPIINRLVMNKPYLEIMVGFVAIYAWLTRSTTFISMVLYWNSLRLLYPVNAPLQRAFANVNTGMLKFMNHPRVPPFIRNNYISASNWIWLKCQSS